MQIAQDGSVAWSAAPDIPYRGKRAYLHGTDLHAAATAIVIHAAGPRSVTRLDVRFPRFTRHAGIFRLVGGEPDRTILQNSPVRIQATLDDGETLSGWYDESNEPARIRSENFESAIVAATRIEGDTARYLGDRGPPAIEIIVFLTKTLLLAQFPDGPGKWVFTALRTDGVIGVDDPCDINVTLINAIGGRAASCAVMCGGEAVGDIYFGRAEE